MESVMYGYVRVSSRDQREDRQVLALREFQVPDQNIFMDKLSGKDFNRPQYRRMVKKIKKGDVLVIKSVDRLGRNYEEILEQWQLLTKEKHVDVVVLDMPLLDTRKSEKNLMGVFMADLVLQILSYVAQAERENILQRQKEGIAAARRRGVKFGRPKKNVPAEFEQVKREWTAKKISSREAARQLGISQDTFLRWAREPHLECRKLKKS